MGDFFSSLSGHPSGIATYQEPSLVPAIYFFDLGFEITTTPQQAIDFGLSAVLGWTSTLAPSAAPYISGVGISFGFPGSLDFGSEFFTDDNILPADQADVTLGAWLFRPTAVPLSPTLSLVLVGLIGLVVNRHRR